MDGGFLSCLLMGRWGRGLHSLGGHSEHGIGRGVRGNDGGRGVVVSHGLPPAAIDFLIV